MKYLTIIVVATMLTLTGCGNKDLNYGNYQGKVMQCESMNMTVHVVNGFKNNLPYVKEVICYDKYGATWDTSKMSE